MLPSPDRRSRPRCTPAASLCRLRRVRRRTGTVGTAVAAFYPLAWVTDRVAGDGVARQQPHRTGHRAARPRPRHRSRPPTSRRPTWSSSSSGFQPAVDETVGTNADGAVLDAAEVVDLLPASEHEHEDEEAGHTTTATSTRTSGWTRCGWPTSATPSPSELTRARPRRRRRRTPQQRGRPARRPRGRSTRTYAAGAGRLRAHHHGRQPRRLRLPRAVRPAVRGDRRPLPRRRADARRPGPAPGR